MSSLRLCVGLERGKDWPQGDSQSSSLSTILESSKGGGLCLTQKVSLNWRRSRKQDIKCHKFRDIKYHWEMLWMSGHFPGPPPVLMTPTDRELPGPVFLPALLRHNWQITLCVFKVYSTLIWYMYALENDYRLGNTCLEISLSKLPRYSCSTVNCSHHGTALTQCLWFPLGSFSTKNKGGEGHPSPEPPASDSLHLEFNHFVFILFLRLHLNYD